MGLLSANEGVKGEIKVLCRQFSGLTNLQGGEEEKGKLNEVKRLRVLRNEKGRGEEGRRRGEKGKEARTGVRGKRM